MPAPQDYIRAGFGTLAGVGAAIASGGQAGIPDAARGASDLTIMGLEDGGVLAPPATPQRDAQERRVPVVRDDDPEWVRMAVNIWKARRAVQRGQTDEALAILDGLLNDSRIRKVLADRKDI